MFLKKRSDMLIHRLQSKEQKRPKSVALNRDRSSLHDLKLTKDTTTTHKDLVIRRNNSQKYLSKFK